MISENIKRVAIFGLGILIGIAGVNMSEPEPIEIIPEVVYGFHHYDFGEVGVIAYKDETDGTVLVISCFEDKSEDDSLTTCWEHKFQKTEK